MPCSKKDLIAFLESIGASPRKHLSQNFLIDGNIVKKICQLAEVKPTDQILEVGPGPGAITETLLSLGANVTAVEKDPLFAHHLWRLQTPDLRLQVYSQDFLQFPLDSLNGQWKAISNIPFHITAPILEKLCTHPSFITYTVIVQKEVGDRIKAKPKTKEYGSLTLFLQFYTTVLASFPIPATCFYPRPKVDSTALLLKKREPPNIDPQRFFFLVRKAFQQRRKMVTSSLREILPSLSSILVDLGISTKTRPEELSLEEWISIYSKIDSTIL